MKRPAVNALLDLSAAALVAGVLATGLVLQLVLPPGSGRAWVLWSLERHDWAALHAWVSVALVGVLVVHVALHWRWVVEMTAKRLGGRSMSSGALAAIVVAGLVLLFVAFAGAAYSTREPRKSLAECDAPAAVSPSNAAQPDAPRPGASIVSYEIEVAPLLARRCVRCHDTARPEGGVRLDDYEAARSYAMPGQATEGRLLGVVREPRDAAHTLDAVSVDLLERWVSGGAAR